MKRTSSVECVPGDLGRLVYSRQYLDFINERTEGTFQEIDAVHLYFL